MAAVTKPPLGAPRRMTLANLIKGKQQEPVRVLLFGPEGVGKSTFGADAPKPIFLAPEDGTGQLDVPRFPKPETWDETLEAVRTLTEESHDFQTLVIDTLDHLEPLLWRKLCVDAKVDLIEDIGGGFGRGYVAAVDGWRSFLAALERMRTVRKMGIVMLAHSCVRTFKSPDSDDFDRYELKLHAKSAGLLKEWVDAVLFANYETLTAKDGKTKRVKGVSTGARLIYTVRTAAYDAKNRYNLPESLPLSWAEFASEMRGDDKQVAATIEAIREKSAGLSPDDQAKVAKAIERAGGDAAKLAQLNDWINAQAATIAPTANKED